MDVEVAASRILSPCFLNQINQAEHTSKHADSRRAAIPSPTQTRISFNGHALFVGFIQLLLTSPVHLVSAETVILTMPVLKSPRIMFVDDDTHVIDCYRRLLRPFNSTWKVSYFTDSRAAWADMRREPADVLVTDVTMPYLSGIELLEQMKQDESTCAVPVIVITGREDGQLRRSALEAGAADLMNKPIEFEELVARLRSSLRLKACYDELNNKNQQLEERVRDRTRELRQSRVEIVARLAKAAEAARSRHRYACHTCRPLFPIDRGSDGSLRRRR